MKIRVETHFETLGKSKERYVPGGYYDDIDIDRKLEIMSKIDGLDGIFVLYPPDPLPSDPDKLVKKLNNHGLEVASIYPDNFTDKKWKYGAFSDTSGKIRKENIKICKECIDFAKAINSFSVLLWPAHDGFDYPFQTNYKEGWKYLVETFREIGEYDKNVKIAIESKSKDPRQRQYVSNVGKEIALLNEIGLENVGGVVDTGHAFMAQESIAETLELLDYYNKLYQIHLNENYRDSDPDLLFGTINFWENLEFFYFLNKTSFDGWINIDIQSPRTDRIKTLEMGTRLIWKYKELAEKLEEHSDEIDNNLNNYSFIDNMDLITRLIF